MTLTAVEMAYLGGRAGLAAPLMVLPEPAPEIAPLGAPLTTTHRVISYTYDSLYRLTDAEYSTGQFYRYAYDAVGNRLSLTTTVGVVNYAYDVANRLTSVNGQAYTWDNNGNLLSDGLRTYEYDHANRLTQVVSGTLTTQFAYNGAGDRVAKTVDGVTTGYVLDPAAGLTQVLQETTGGQTQSYLYGHDLLAQYDSGTWAYHVNDGLGSVRQLADPTGQVVQGYSFDPFGVPLGESGGEPYGYTGEQWDASAGLVYLRARYYEPGMGRFTQSDPYFGSIGLPSSLNRYVYARSNPALLTDPSGLVPPPPGTLPPPSLRLDSTVEEVINFFEWLYHKKGFLVCDTIPDDGVHSTDTAWDLFVDFVCERGPQRRNFLASYHLTQELAKSSIIHDIRKRFYEGDAAPLDEKEYEFQEGGFLQATLDFLVYGDTQGLREDWPDDGNARVIARHIMKYANVTHFLGTFDYKVRLAGVPDDRVIFEIKNKTGRASGSHVPGRFEPEYYQSLERLVEREPEVATKLAIPYILSNPVISVLRDYRRARTPDPIGGGNMYQTFSWMEPYPLLGCTKWLPPWPAVIPFLKDNILDATPGHFGGFPT